MAANLRVPERTGRSGGKPRKRARNPSCGKSRGKRAGKVKKY